MRRIRLVPIVLVVVLVLVIDPMNDPGITGLRDCAKSKM